MQNLGNVETTEVDLSLEVKPNEVQENVKNEKTNRHPVEIVWDITRANTNETNKSAFIALSDVVDAIKCNYKSTYVHDDSTYENSDLAINNSVYGSDSHSELDAEEVVTYVDTMDFLQSDDE
eukprot:6693740-Ditylum_brightwellii.AAC.1